MSDDYFLNMTVGEYRLVDFLGAGGMGEVYRAVHTKLGRVAAIKVLTNSSRGGDFVERFFNEARIQASLQHPNIATLYDFLELQGRPCIVMEYVDGQTLSDMVRPHGPLPLDDALRIFESVVDAIACVHEHGIVHRDIKSNNIKISSKGQVKLLDFGIAKGQTSPGLTEAGSVVGTLEYLSPEQLATGTADFRSDIWALGVLLYETTTGRVPFEAQTLGTLCEKIGRAEYPPPLQINPALPRDLVAIISRCLKKSPSERFASAKALQDEVRKLRASLDAHTQRAQVSTPRQSTREEVRPPVETQTWLARHWLKLAGAAVLGAVILIFAVAGIIYGVAGGHGADDGPAGRIPSMGEKIRSIKIEMSDGPARIYRGDELLGEFRSVDIAARVGESVTLRFEREGHTPKVVTFDVEENTRGYTFKMDR